MISRSKTWKLKNKSKLNCHYISVANCTETKRKLKKRKAEVSLVGVYLMRGFPHWWSTLVIHEAPLWLSLVTLTGSYKAFIHLFSLSSRVFCILGICWNLIEDYIISQILIMFKDPLQNLGLLWAPSAGGSSLCGWLLRAGTTNRRDNRKRHWMHWNPLKGEKVNGRGLGRVQTDVKKKKKKREKKKNAAWSWKAIISAALFVLYTCIWPSD